MTISSVTTQNATTASGAVAIVSASASTKVSTLPSAETIPSMMEVISWSEYIATFSAFVMVLSFCWNIYSSRKKSALIKKQTDAENRTADAQEESNKIERDKLQYQIDVMNKIK